MTLFARFSFTFQCSNQPEFKKIYSSYFFFPSRYTRLNSTIEKGLWDTKDYDVSRTIEQLRQVLLHPLMQTRNSVLLINYGLHFAESLNFTNFKTAINAVTRLLRNEAKCQVTWRTTTSLNRHKYSQPNVHSRRFMTTPVRCLINKSSCDTQ